MAQEKNSTEASVEDLFDSWKEASVQLHKKAGEYREAGDECKAARDLFVKAFAEARQASPVELENLLFSL
ncbi:hypothetical protein ACTORR_01520 [Pseudomonas sp. SAR267]|uniref:hypothetical protein n=1 Tax=Pseudomonas sp. SAR267 TaxID=3454502 RepID=UPI003F902C26